MNFHKMRSLYKILTSAYSLAITFHHKVKLIAIIDSNHRTIYKTWKQKQHIILWYSLLKHFWNSVSDFKCCILQGTHFNYFCYSKYPGLANIKFSDNCNCQTLNVCISNVMHSTYTWEFNCPLAFLLSFYISSTALHCILSYRLRSLNTNGNSIVITLYRQHMNRMLWDSMRTIPIFHDLGTFWCFCVLASL